MESIKKSFEAMITAGYDLLHVDPTLDIFNEDIKIETVVNRTVELISYSEKFRKKNNLKPISYEVGTEEVKGGLSDVSIFNEFLGLLKAELAQNNLSSIWPIFVVGKVGTDLHTTYFDPELAKKLVKILKKYGSYLKGHYTDFVSNPHEYPLSGVGGANVGPEFTSSEHDAFEELAALEESIYKNNFIAQKSDFMKILEDAVMKSGRWKKWLRGSEKDLNSLSQERKRIIVKTSCRYTWAEPAVKCAQQHLFNNLEFNGIDAENWVLMKIEKVMDKYFREFNLIDLIGRIESNK